LLIPTQIALKHSNAFEIIFSFGPNIDIQVDMLICPSHVHYTVCVGISAENHCTYAFAYSSKFDKTLVNSN